MAYVALTGEESVDLCLIDVETKGTEPGFDESTNQRKTNVAQADNAHASVLVPNGCDELRRRIWYRRLVLRTLGHRSLARL
jgi:hypothetical protein